MPDPKVGPGDVLVDIAYAAINYPDTLIVQGLYQVKPQPPFVPGHECAGVVREIGEGVAHFKPGDRVYVSCGTGGIAEQISVKHFRVRHVPDGVPLDIAATVSVAYGTALHALKDLAELQEGESVLVLGASGGTGSAAIEIAKAMGATVYAAVSTDEKAEYCRQLGADHVINYDTEDLKLRIDELTSKQGVNVVFDPVGDRYAEPALRSLGFRGRYLVVGFAAGEIPHLPVNLALLSERSIIGVYVAAWAQKRGQEVLANNLILGNWVKKGVIKPNITARYSLEDAPQALLHASSRKVLGKIVVEVDSKLR
jgi:NADPH2:quinone reductase